MPPPPFTRDQLRLQFGSVFARGEDYFKRGKVADWEADEEYGCWSITGQVKGSERQPYTVTLDFDGAILDGTCSCPYYQDCKHAVALGLDFLDQLDRAGPDEDEAEDPAWAAAVRDLLTVGGVAETTLPRFHPVYQLAVGEAGPGLMELRLRVGFETPQGFRAETWRDLYWASGAIPPGDFAILCEVRACLRRPGQPRKEPWVPVDGLHVDHFLGLLSAVRRVTDGQGQPLRVLPEAPLVVGFVYDATAGTAWLRPADVAAPGAPTPVFLGTPPRWAWIGEALRPLAQPPRSGAAPRPVPIAPADRAAFETLALPDLVVAGRVTTPGRPVPVVTAGVPAAQVLLVERAGALDVRLGFLYGGVRVEAATPAAHVGPPEGPWFARDRAAEAAARERLGGGAPGVFTLEGDAALDFLHDVVPGLLADGVAVLGEDALPSLRVSRQAAYARLAIASGIDWFEVKGGVEVDGQAVPWPALAAAIAAGRRYVRLGTGAHVRLPADWFARRQRLLDALAVTDAELAAGTRVARFHAPTLDMLADAADAATGDEGWRAFIGRLRSFGGIAPAPVPAGFAGALRPYQQGGLDYLSFLRDHGLHGILADDMGLGKTVQAAALLAANHARPGTAPSLVVAPASVIGNWQQELARFAPGLRTLVLHGPDRDHARIGDFDVVITTYATLRLDLAHHQDRTYDTVILDEAQAIKNADAVTARAARALTARHRLALSGTPIENHLGELWSQFAFLMPGLLGTQEAFRRRYTQPIALGDAAAAAELKARVAPFVLRRLKGDVATDLPPRTDTVVWCELGSAQRAAYEAALAACRDEVMAHVATDGLERSQFAVLTALLRLRQLCCHPALLALPDTVGLPSAKLDRFLELVIELIAGGHRALVFSQFTALLALLREALDARGVAYDYLDGQTPAGKRQAKVERFNAGDAPLFLISLKAGGTGLNLTGADYVIHFDPWWNPAVEDQATDRVHRIGQTRPVIAYKLIARDTVEEKLLAMQARKRALASEFIDVDALGKRLTLDDLQFLFAGARPETSLPPGRSRRK